MNKNDIITLKIEDMGVDGEGIGKLDGMTFFVKDAVIGDEIEVFGPGRDFFSQKLDFMQDEEGNNIESAPHPQQIVQIRMKEPVAENFILRKRKGQADC